MILNEISKSKENSKQKIFRFSIDQLSSKKGVRIRNDELDKATRPLISKIIKIPRIDGGWLMTSYASSAEYNKEIGIVEIELSEKILPFYQDVTNRFTLFDVNIALKLKSKYAKKFYEIVSRFKDIGQKRFEIEELKELLGIIIDDGKKVKDKYPQFNKFQERVLDVCRDEINNKTELTISYSKPEKYKRKYSAITVYINSGTFQHEIEFEDEKAKLYSRLINDLKLSKKQAVTILRDYTEKEITNRIYTIKINHNKKGSIGGYAATIFGV